MMNRRTKYFLNVPKCIDFIYANLNLDMTKINNKPPQLVNANEVNVNSTFAVNLLSFVLKIFNSKIKYVRTLIVRDVIGKCNKSCFCAGEVNKYFFYQQVPKTATTTNQH